MVNTCFNLINTNLMLKFEKLIFLDISNLIKFLINFLYSKFLNSVNFLKILILAKFLIKILIILLLLPLILSNLLLFPIFVKVYS